MGKFNSHTPGIVVELSVNKLFIKVQQRAVEDLLVWGPPEWY